MKFLPGRQSLVFTSAEIIALVTVLLLFLTHKWCWIRYVLQPDLNRLKPETVQLTEPSNWPPSPGSHR
jgi:hypothetical protein